jgi:membrane protein implicated in regulation of membrane protease activity
MAFELWHLWIVAGILLFVLEIFTPGFVAAAIAVGCLAGAVPAFLGASAAWQLGSFAAGTLVAFVGARPFVLRHLTEGGDGYASNVEGLLGQDGTVLEGVPGQGGGRVRVGGEDWRAVSASGEALEAGQTVTVVAVEGNKLVVLRADAFEKR